MGRVRVLPHSQAWEWNLFLTTITVLNTNCWATNTFLLLFLRNAGDRDKVWTFGGGPRQCIGKHLSNTLLKVVYLPILESSSRNWKGLEYNFTFFFVLCKSVNGCLEKSEVMLSCIVWKIKTCAIGESDISSRPSSSLRSAWRSSWGATHGSWSQAKTWPTRLFQFQGPRMTFRLFLPDWQLQHDVAPFQKQKLFQVLYHMECHLSYTALSVHSQSPKPSNMYIYSHV